MIFEKNILLLFGLQIVIWLTYFVRPLVGADPYFYLSGVCSGNVVSPDMGFNLLLQLLPCNVFVFQTILLLVWLALLFVVWRIGCLFDSDKGWWLPYIVFSMTFFIFEFWKFENNVFGYLFAFIGFYFVFKYFMNKGGWAFDLNNKCLVQYNVVDLKNLFFVGLFFGLSFLFWKGVVYWFFVLPFFNFLFIPFFGLVFLPNFLGFFTSALSNTMVYEHSLFIGLNYLFMTPLFFIGFLKTNKQIVLACIVLLIPCVLILKMYVLPVLFISIICFNCLKMFEQKININLTLKTWAILMTIFFIINLGTQFPTQDDIDLIQNIVDKNKDIENTFGTGYIIRWLGGTEKYYSSYTKPVDQKGYIIEMKDKNFDCILIEESRHLRSWKCD
jgi:hypothetical protein